MNEPKTIIVRTPNYLGDHIMAFPFYFNLRKLYPNSKIVLLTLENFSELIPKNIFNAKLLIKNEYRHNISYIFELAKIIKTISCDLAISLPASFSSAFIFFISKIPNRIGFSDSTSDILYSATIKWNGVGVLKHRSEQYLELLKLLNPTIKSVVAYEHTSDSFRDNVIAIAPTTQHPLREWPYFETLILELRKRYWAFRIVIIGTDPKWHKIINRIGDHKIEDYVEKTSIMSALEIFKKAKLTISNDSGPAHLAATLGGSPTVIIYGPGNPNYIKPYGKIVRQITPIGVPCFPCERNKCHEKYGYKACLRQIQPSRVLDLIKEILF